MRKSPPAHSMIMDSISRQPETWVTSSLLFIQVNWTLGMEVGEKERGAKEWWKPLLRDLRSEWAAKTRGGFTFRLITDFLFSLLKPSCIGHPARSLRKSQCLSHRGQESRIYWKECLTPKEIPETLLKPLLRFLDTPVMSQPLFWDVEPKPVFHSMIWVCH